MSEITQHHCLNCGGTLTDVGGDTLKCKYCGSTFENRSLERKLQSMQELLDQAKWEYVNNQRRNLYDAVHAKYVSMSEVRQYATEIKKYLPNDFQANFYLQAISGDAKEINDAIRAIDEDTNYDSLPAVIHFLIASLQVEYLLELNNLVERAYKKRDLPLFSHFATEISQEAEKVSAGIYATSIPRDVFIAYSSKDMGKVSELCEKLESQGISCFVAARNLRHGVGAVENYDSALKEAMNNCRCFVFVSSVNSRSLSCDAVTKEIPYLRSRDIENAPAHLRNNYAAIPDIYKKPRVEYRIGTENSADAVARITDAFFEGHEWVYTPEAVAVRVVQLLYEEQPTAVPINPEPIPAPQATAAPPRSKKKKNKAPLAIVATLLLAVVLIGGAMFVPGLIGDQDAAVDPQTNLQTTENNSNLSDTSTEEPAVTINTEQEETEPDPVETTAQTAATQAPAITGGQFTPSYTASPSVSTTKAPTTTSTTTVATTEPPVEFVENPSQGLAFTSMGNGTCYLSGIGTCTDTDLVIPSLSPSGERVIGIKSQAFWHNSKLISVTIPKGVTTIEKNAFEHCTNIKYVVLPDTVTTIGNSAFTYCHALTSINLPEGLTAIPNNLFSNCKALTSITIPSTVTSIGTGAFSSCSDMAALTIPEGVTSIETGAFSGCIKLQTLIVPNTVKHIGEKAFNGCSGLITVSLPSSVTSIGTQAFFNCKNVIEFTVDPANEHYQSAGNCLIETSTQTLQYGFKAAVIPTNIPITRINSYAFQNNTDIPYITIPNGVTWIGDSAFQDCNCSGFLTIPASLQYIGQDTFRGNHFSGISVAAGNTVYKGGVNCLIETATKRLIVAADIANGVIIPADGSVTHIGSYVFEKFNKLTAIQIPNGVTTIEDFAFSYCFSLKEVNMANSVTHIGDSAFYSAQALTSVTWSENLTYIGEKAFNICSNLVTSIHLDNVEYIGKTAFGACKKLTSVTLSEKTKTIEDNAFSSCSKLTDITIPGNLDYLGNYAFRGCGALSSITVTGSGTKYHSSGNCLIETASQTLILGCLNSTIPTDGSVTKIGDYAFYGYSQLTDITIPKTITSIGASAFYNCALTTVVIPEGVTHIGKDIFDNCGKLTSLYLPMSLISMGDYAIYRPITDIYYAGTETQWNKLLANSSSSAVRYSPTLHYNSVY